jgi:serine/threonine-protein kinase
MLLSPGAIVAQHYELGRLLGVGGMGEVWSAKHLSTQAWVALKFLKEPAELELTRRFVREARAAAAVRHPNVIGIHNVLMLEEGLPVMVMDLLDGESLAARLVRTGPIPVSELVGIMVPVFSAVGAAHALGIVHRDLKPDNIFLAQRGQGVEPIVLDFGICKLSPSEALPLDDSTLTVTGSIMGTPCYMAPEQIFGEKDVDARADVWALGVILYECTTGRRPVQGENVGQLIKHIISGVITPLQELAPHVPPEFSNVVSRMLTRDRAERLPDLRQAFETLRAMTDVSAQSFGAATTLKVLPSQPGPEAPQFIADSALGSGVSGSLVASSVAVAAPKRSLPVLFAALAGIVMLGLLGRAVFSSNGAAPRIDAHPSAASAEVVISEPASPPPITEAAASSAPDAMSKPASDTKPLTSAKPHNARPKPPRMLSGGVHGTVPF